MPITPSSYIERLKRDAKAARRDRGLTHTRALDAIAARHGFPHWKALSSAYDAGSFPSASQLAAAAASVNHMTPAEIERMLRDHFDNAVGEGTILPAIDNQYYAGPLSDEGMDVPDWLVGEFPDLPDRHSDLLHKVGWDLEADGPWVHRCELDDPDPDGVGAAERVSEPEPPGTEDWV